MRVFYGWQKFGWLNTTPTIRQPETAQSNTAQPTPNSQTAISGCLYQPTHPIGSLKTNKVRFGTTLSASQRHFAM